MNHPVFKAGDLLQSTNPLTLMCVGRNGTVPVYFTEPFMAVVSNINRYEVELLVYGDLYYVPLQEQDFSFKKVA